MYQCIFFCRSGSKIKESDLNCPKIIRSYQCGNNSPTWSDIWNVSYIELRMWNQVSHDPRSYELNLCNCVKVRTWFYIWNISYICHCTFIPDGLIRTHKWPSPNVRGFVAQLVRASHRYREVTSSNPVELLAFSSFYIRNFINWSCLRGS